MPSKMHGGAMQNTESFIDAANNDSEREGAPKKGHGYTGKGYGGGRDQMRSLPGSADSQGRTVVQESRGMDGGHGSVGQEKGMSGPAMDLHAVTRHPQECGTPYAGDPNARGGWAKKVGYGEL